MADAADDCQLLERYAHSRDPSAFGEIARRHLNLVYSAAVRRVGDRHLAEDVTQAVMLILATRPDAARRSASLSAWLLTTVRYAAANAMKVERRRRRHEATAATAAASGACSSNPADVLVWQEVASQLDDAVLALPALDRRAVLLRYFEQKPIRDVATSLRTTEAAAKQRLSRSVEKLRQRLNRRGAGLAPAGAAGLTTLLAAHAVRAAPPALFDSTCAALAGNTAAAAASSAIAKGAVTMMTWAKIKTVAAVLVVASVLGTGAAVGVRRGMVRAQDPATVPAVAAAAPLRDKAAARLRAAEEVLTALAERETAGEPLTPSFVELKGTALRRLTEARIDAAETPASDARAAEEYVQQVREFVGVLEGRFNAGLDVSRVQLTQAKYHLADAEYLLAKLQTGR